MRRAHPSAPGPRVGVRGATNGPVRFYASTLIVIDDVERTIAAWSGESGVPVENIRHRLAAGWESREAIWGPVVPRKRLTESQVAEIRALRARGHTYYCLARDFGIRSQRHVWAICAGRSWK